jgi:hypothetical protein
MIKYFIKYVVCKIKGHSLIDIGSCPVTNKSYNACTKCGATISK